MTSKKNDEVLAQLSMFVNDSDEAIVVTDLDGIVVGWSLGAEQLYGYTREQAVGRPISFVRDSETDEIELVLARLRAGERPELLQGTRRRADGSNVEVEVRVSPVREAYTVVGAMAIARDVSAHLRREQELKDSRAFLERTQQIAKIGSWRSKMGPEAVLTWSDETYRVFGLAPGNALTNLEFLRLVHEEDRELLLETFVRVRTEGARGEVELRIRRPDGEVRWALITAEAELDENGAVIGQSGMLQDITERKHAEIQIAYHALHDELTGLPNRNLFLDRLDRALGRARAEGSRLAVMYFDLDHFQKFNDARGHVSGDDLLRAVAARIRGMHSTTDTVARISADEFGVVIERVGSAASAAAHAERVIRYLEQPFELAQGEALISSSAGIAMSRDDASAEVLLRDADLAMYRAKVKGRHRVELYDLELRREAEERFSIEGALRRALSSNELFLEFQPIASLTKNRYVGAEALVRWRHPERGVIAPEEFIPIAEENGLIVAFGSWVLGAACAQFNAWRAFGGLGIDWRGSVNVSAAQLKSPDFVEVVMGALSSSGLPPSCLRIELTESSVAEPDTVADALRQVRALGVEISIDDFGTKYSSLNYLAHLPIDELKIPRPFIEELAKDRQNQAIVASIVAVGKALGLKVTAEGIDTKEQLEAVRVLGCDAVQGHYFAEALPPEDCLAVLLSDPGVAP